MREKHLRQISTLFAHLHIFCGYFLQVTINNTAKNSIAFEVGNNFKRKQMFTLILDVEKVGKLKLIL